MVGVTQDDFGSNRSYLVGGESFDRGLSCHRHERRRGYHAVGGVHLPSAGFGLFPSVPVVYLTHVVYLTCEV